MKLIWKCERHTSCGEGEYLMLTGLLALMLSGYFSSGVLGLNYTRGIDVCVLLFFLCCLCVGSDLAMGRSPVQRVLLTMYNLKKLKKAAKAKKGL
jgi:hypothetical protein